MSKTPRDISGRRVVTALERVGFYLLHQRGSHIILRRESPKATISVPDHRTLRVGTLRKILAQAGLEVDQFLELL
jgi:predicted RNA binding protein YcfA (HicA-like mRNA interferase family)